MNERIYDHGNKNQYTRVVFGEGRIQVGSSKIDKCGFVQVHLSDTLKPHKVSIDRSAWESTDGRVVLLDFNNVTSIEVVELALKEAKDKLIADSEGEESGA